jgi:site-specific DNA-methyltransferase (adenine-specific)
MNWKDNFPKQNRAFETQNGILYHGNSEEILPLFKDNSINGIITDPPYVYLKHKLDKNFDEELIIGNFSRLTKNGILAIFGRGLSFYKRNLIASKYGFNFKEEIIWNKKRMSNPMGVIGRIHENIAIFSKGKKLNKIRIDTFQDIDNREEYSIYKDRLRRLIKKLRTFKSYQELQDFLKGEYTKKKKSNYYLTTNKDVKQQDIAYKLFKQFEEGSLLKSIIYEKTEHWTAKHPTQKPLALMEKLVKLTSNENEIILDSFAGGGSTLLALEKLNRNWIGIEIDEEYIEVAKNRFAENLLI